ncbi:MAG: hypothetical protein V9H26_03210 [Verrucomicrobiota bacterium]
MRLGKHCFCQKPLTQTVAEARAMRALAAEKKLATQMGNQGSAEDGLRRAIEVIQAGVIGQPLELHVWSNRPVWPQGLERSVGQDPVPANLDWDVWLGPAAIRPFKQGVYHTFNWRGWFDFRHRGAGGHGLPHGQHAVPRAEARLPDGGRMRVGFADLPGNVPQNVPRSASSFRSVRVCPR